METIFVVDDDAGVRKALTRVLREAGWNVEAFDSAEAFVDRPDREAPACLVLDVDMPGLDGLELQRRLRDDNEAFPVIFLTGHGDIPMSVKAIKAGAADFLTKPVSGDVLIAAVRNAIGQHAATRETRAEVAVLENRLAKLT